LSEQVSSTGSTTSTTTGTASPVQSTYTSEQVQAIATETASQIARTEFSRLLAPLTEQIKALAPKAPETSTEQTKETPQSPAENGIVRQLQKQIQDLQAGQTREADLRKQAEERAIATSRESIIRQEFSKFSFAGDAASNDAFALIAEKIKSDGNGGFASVEENLPVKDFVEKFLTEQRPYLLAPTPRSGSGAPQSGTQHAGYKKPVELEQLGPGMTKETMQSAARQILALLNPAR
jgi:hypothetical protein